MSDVTSSCPRIQPRRPARMRYHGALAGRATATADCSCQRNGFAFCKESQCLPKVGVFVSVACSSCISYRTTVDIAAPMLMNFAIDDNSITSLSELHEKTSGPLVRCRQILEPFTGTHCQPDTSRQLHLQCGAAVRDTHLQPHRLQEPAHRLK